ncbi:hypothetical protein QAD02_013722 [Eretmocerus hayati]|uniref:Uncharacterized protein n=1 Tax=Eretmocerus hayati TaxID=131215 RepID=A0ACC2P2X7_9HYME|nr:hypothetical protein QAD02_013722 [Eretmocerus hayati]
MESEPVNPPGTSEDRQSTQKSIFNEPIVLADLTREHSLPNEELIRNISRTLNNGTDDMNLDEPSPSPNDHECPNDVCNGEPQQLQVDDIVQNFWEALAVSHRTFDSLSEADNEIGKQRSIISSTSEYHDPSLLMMDSHNILRQLINFNVHSECIAKPHVWSDELNENNNTPKWQNFVVTTFNYAGDT